MSVATSSGSLTGQQSATLSVTATTLNTLTPGTYNGTVTIIGTDGNGHGVPGSPQIIPVSFVVQAACTVTTSPSALTFASVVGQAAPVTQPVTIAATGACSHTVDWTATTSTSWLVPTPATGVATLASVGKSTIGIISTETRGRQLFVHADNLCCR